MRPIVTLRISNNGFIIRIENEDKGRAIDIPTRGGLDQLVMGAKLLADVIDGVFTNVVPPDHEKLPDPPKPSAKLTTDPRLN